MGAKLRTGPAFEVEDLRPLLDASGYTVDIYRTSYEVLPGGRGFLFLRQRQSERGAARPQLVEAEHWFADVRARSAH